MRLAAKRSGDDVIYYVLDSARNGGKVESWTVQRIGKRSELAREHPDPEAYARSVVEGLNAARRGDRVSFKQTVDFGERLPADGTASESLSRNVGWLYVKRAFEEMGLPSFLESVRGQARYSLPDAVLLLTVGRLLSPCSVRKTHAMAEGFLGMPETSPESLYRALGRLQANSDAFQRAVYEGLSGIVDRDESVVYYDCTNFYSETEAEDDDLCDAEGDPIQYGMRKYGASKEHRPNPIVQMGLFVDRNGIPISHNLFHGSRNEQDGLVEEERRMAEIRGGSEFVYCADGGLNSYPARLYNSFGKRGYVVTQSLRKLKEEELKLLMADANWRFLDDDSPVSLETFRAVAGKYAAGEDLSEEEKAMLRRDTVYKAFPTAFKADLTPFLRNVSRERRHAVLDETLYVTFSARCFLYQRGVFSRQLSRAKDWVAEGRKGRKNPNGPERLISEEHATAEGEAAEKKVLSIDEGRADRERALHGFYAVASNLDGGIRRIMGINKGRWQIEMRFRTMKGLLCARPFYKSTPEGIRGHFQICFLALCILTALRRRLQKEIGDAATITEEDIVGTLRNMETVREEKPARYMSIYTGSKVLEALEKVFRLGLDRKYHKPSRIAELSGTKDLK